MPNFIEYRYVCQTEGTFVYEIRKEEDGPPTSCKNDPSHTIDASSIRIMSRSEENEVVTSPKQGGFDHLVDGGHIIASNNTTRRVVVPVPEGDSVHLIGMQCNWKNCQLGDIGMASIIKEINLTVSSNTSTTITLSDSAEDFNPGQGAEHIEVWNSDLSELKEVIEIQSVTANTVTLENSLTASVSSGDRVFPRYRSFSPVRGALGKEGGIRLMGDGFLGVKSDFYISDPLSSDFSFCIILIADNVELSPDRECAINFIMVQK